MAIVKKKHQKQEKRKKEQNNRSDPIFDRLDKGVEKVGQNAAGSLRDRFNGHKDLIGAFHESFDRIVERESENDGSAGNFPNHLLRDQKDGQIEKSAEG